MAREEQDKLRKALYNGKFTTDAEDENPFVGIYFNDLLDIIHDFGQQHPAWVSVEERLPEPDPEYELRLSVDCFITDGVNIETGYYNYRNKCWNHGSMPNITHWFIPTPPVEKGGEE